MGFFAMLATMEKTYQQKANLIVKHFGVYGIGHFDLTASEVATLLEILDKQEAKAELKDFYEKLYARRMG